jgi:hypothetical protein
LVLRGSQHETAKKLGNIKFAGDKPVSVGCGATFGARIALAECGRAEFVQLRPHLLSGLPTAFHYRLYSHGDQQGSRRLARIPRIAKYGMQSLVN